MLCQRCWSTELWQLVPGQAASEVLPQGPQNANGHGQQPAWLVLGAAGGVLVLP